MTHERFLQVCAQPEPPAALTPELLSLYWDARGDWGQAHTVAQEIETPLGSALHAYLHRKEGDAGNARYWYTRAGRPVHRGTLDDEWNDLARECCK